MALNRCIRAAAAPARAQLGYAELLAEAPTTAGRLGMARLEPARQQARTVARARKKSQAPRANSSTWSKNSGPPLSGLSGLNGPMKATIT